MSKKPTILMILDGYGLNEKTEGNAIAMAKTPNMDKLMEAHEHDCSVNKYISYEELPEYDSPLSLDDCKTMTMHDLHEAISHCHEGHTDTSSKGENEEHHKEHKEGNQHGH